MENGLTLPENITVGFKWRVRYTVRKLKLKNKKTIYQQSHTEVSHGPDMLYLVKALCKKRKHELVAILSHQAVGVAFAYYCQEPDFPFLTSQEKQLIPLPNDGKEIPYVKPLHVVFN